MCYSPICNEVSYMYIYFCLKILNSSKQKRGGKKVVHSFSEYNLGFYRVLNKFLGRIDKFCCNNFENLNCFKFFIVSGVL